jgi:hypothetical protein
VRGREQNGNPRSYLSSEHAHKTTLIWRSTPKWISCQATKCNIPERIDEEGSRQNEIRGGGGVPWGAAR